MTVEPQLRSVRLARWRMAAGCIAAVAGYLVVNGSGSLGEYGTAVLRDIFWCLAGLTAALSCAVAARHTEGRQRTAWLLMALGCGAWFGAQAVWSYYELVARQRLTFPHWMQGLILVYSLLFVSGLMTLPKPRGTPGFTIAHAGNLALIGCTAMVVLIVALLEPAIKAARPRASTVLMLVQVASLAAMFMTALYLLWSYRWRRMHWSLALIAFGSGLHITAFLTFLHQSMIDSYRADSGVNVTWLIVFGAYACAAYERTWQAKYRPAEDPTTLLVRARTLEALMPALLIVTMLVVVSLNAQWITPRVATLSTGVAILFAIILGLREGWIQRQEQRLLSALHDSNENILRANRDLSQSESRYRTLSAELERRVTERTEELRQAYLELEHFSFAVAHDLKAPLRSVDGFGTLLHEEYSEKLDEKGRGYVQRMRRSVQRMAQLIDDLLAYARVDQREYRPEPVDLPALIKGVIAEQETEIERQHVQLQTNVALVSVSADTDGLTMACRNLLQNALKFSRQSQPPRISISVSECAEGIRISIEDNGIGFDMSYQEQIFEMFQRLHRDDEFPGTGIGLAIVRKAVERMGGRVWAKSVPGAGATFHMLFPTGVPSVSAAQSRVSDHGAVISSE